MLRWIFALLMFFLSRRGGGASAPAIPSMSQITQAVTEKLQGVLLTVLTGFFLLLLSMSGFVLTLFVLAQQYDRDGALAWSATLSVGLGLFLLPLLILALSGLRLRQTLRPAQPTPTHSATSPLPQALEQLAVQWLQDQIEERQFRRRKNAAQRGTHDHSNASSSPDEEAP